MSMYNNLFGMNPLAPALLRMLDLMSDSWPVPRFRDCWWDGEHIVVFTRTGGGNRDEYEGSNEILHHHPEFVSDRDNDFDSTYAEFRFKLPEKWLYLKPKFDEYKGRDFSERFNEVMEKLQNPEAHKNDPQIANIIEFGHRLFGAIDTAIKSGPDSPKIIEI